MIAGIPPTHTGPLIESGLFAGIPRGYAASLLFDFPKHFATWSPTGQGRSPLKHYATMSPDQMLAHAPEVAALCAPHCWVFAWWPDPHLPQLLPFLTACGFVFSGKAFTWLKMRKGWEEDSAFTERDVFLGLGHTTREQTETCWLARRGKPGRLSKGIREVIVAAVREHSRKPDQQYPRIEAFCEGPRIELFARCHRPGWVVWGDQIDMFPPATPAPIIHHERKDPDMAVTNAAPQPTIASADHATVRCT